MNLKSALTQYGLKANQAAVFLACLEIGSGSVAAIAKRAGLSRSSCEAILESLHRGNFVTSFRKKRVLHYAAQDPRTIVQEAHRKAAALEQVLPQFLAKYSDSRIQSNARYYEGREGVRLMLDELLKEAPELLSWGSVDDLFETMETFPDFVEKRFRKKIPVRAILPDTPKARDRQKVGVEKLMQVSIIPQEYQQRNAMAFLWRHKIALVSLHENPTVIVLESEGLANLQRSMFNALWDAYSKRV
jgi:sugar-specific transcriptional regulator TrmB